MKKIKNETDQTGSNAGKVVLQIGGDTVSSFVQKGNDYIEKHNPDTVEEHLKAGFVTAQESEVLQKSGKVVKEIKIIEGQVLHRME